MLLSKTAKVKWNNKNKQYYTDKGYMYTKCGDEFEVPIEDLSPSSKSIVDVLCDFCHETITKKTYQTYRKQHHEKYGDCCAKCQPIKNKLCCMDKYGVDNGSKTPDAISKIRLTFMEKYGVDNISKLDSIKAIIGGKAKENAPVAIKKMRATMVEKYGTTNAMYVDAFVDKQKNTFLEKYGAEHPKQNKDVIAKEREHTRKKYGYDHVQQVPEIRAKTEATCLKRYGCKSSLGNADVREKIAKTLKENGNVPTSSQQLQLCNILKRMYGECILNAPCGVYSLDCFVEVDGIKIDVEYDGRYWHQDKQKDRRRDEVVKAKGYKVIRIESDKILPTEEQLRSAIEVLLNTDKKFIKINMV